MMPQSCSWSRLLPAPCIALSCALFTLGGGCVGEKPPGALPPLDEPKVQPRCQGDSTRLLGDINIAKAGDLELFTGCRVIVGNVVVDGAVGVENLDALNTIEQIDGFLYIGHNPDLLTTEALNGVTRIGRGISVEGNSVLGVVEFEGLTEAFGNLVFDDNPVLARISLPNVTTLEPALVDIDGLGTLAPQGGALIMSANHELEATDFSALREIDGSVDFRGMDFIAALRGFEALTEITGSLSLGVAADEFGDVLGEPNLILSSLEGLSRLERVGGDLIIGFNPALATLDDLSELEEVGGDLIVFENAALTTLGGLSALETIGGDLNLGHTTDFEGNLVTFGNPVLRTLDLDVVESIGGDILVAGNATLESLRDMDELVTLGGDIVLLGNAGLDNLEMPPNLLVIPNNLIVGEFIAPDGRTAIINNVLTDFGAPAFTEINGNFVLVGETPASNLEAFENVTRIGGTFSLLFTEITSTEGMTSLASLGGLEIGRPFEFLEPTGQQAAGFNNPALATIGGFDALAEWGTVNIFGSAALTAIDLGGIPVNGDLTIAGPNAVESLSLEVPSVSGDLVLGSAVLPSGLRFTFGQKATTAIAFPNLTTVGGNIRIDAFENLDTVTFDALTSVGGTVEAFELLELETVDVTLLATVGGAFSFDNIPSLTALTHGLTTIGGNLRLVETPVAVAFDAVTTVGGNITLDGISGTSMAFAALATVDGDIRVERADELTTLDGLATLQTIGGDLVFVENPVLTSAGGLTALTRVEGNIIARDNATLDVSTVQTIADALEEEVAVLTCGNADDDSC